MPELTPCPMLEPPEIMVLPKRCNGKRVVDYGDKWQGREHSDNKIVCTKCGAVWPMENKGER